VAVSAARGGEGVSAVIWHVTMSVDGFITGPDDTMEWAFMYGASPLADEIMHATGAVLAGRRWYDVATKHYGGVAGIYGGAWKGPVFVLTHNPPEAASDTSVSFVTDVIERAVATALAAAGDRNLEIFGADTARQTLRAGLLDEIVIHLAPVLLGDGVRFYDGHGAKRIDLERIALADAGDLTDLRYRVVK
jgi:dihydrofolate reductase